MTSPNYRLIIADDHPLYREALVAGIAHHFSGSEIIQVESYIQLFERLKKAPESFDLIIIDLKMPGTQGFSGLVFLQKYFPELPVAVVSAYDSLEVKEKCLSFGADSFISKSSSTKEIITQIEQLLSAETLDFTQPVFELSESERDAKTTIEKLTPHQFHIVSLVAEGYLNKQIGDQLNITEKTVKAHLTNIFKLMNVKNRTQAAHFFTSCRLPENPF